MPGSVTYPGEPAYTFLNVYAAPVSTQMGAAYTDMNIGREPLANELGQFYTYLDVIPLDGRFDNFAAWPVGSDPLG